MSQELNNEAERILFEAEIRKINPDVLERWPGGQYKHHGVEGRWEGWQIARATVPAAQQATPDVEVDAALIERLSKLLAGVAVALNGPEPELKRWSYHDLPEKAAALMLEVELYRSAVGAAQQAGWVSVPVEPTEDMLVFGQEAWAHAKAKRHAIEECTEAQNVYAAMIAAAPSAPSEAASVRDAAIEEVAQWYAREGWLMDEDDVPAAIRALQGKPEAAKGGEHD